MLSSDEMAYLSAGLELFATLTTGVLLLGCLIDRSRSTPADRVFSAALIVQIATLVTDALCWLLPTLHTPISAALMQALYCINYSMGCGLIALYAYYLTLYIAQSERISFRWARGVLIGCCIAAALWFAFMFSSLYVCFDPYGNESRGPLNWLSQVFLIALPFAAMLLAFVYRKALGRKETAAMMIYGALPILSIPLQLV